MEVGRGEGGKEAGGEGEGLECVVGEVLQEEVYDVEREVEEE